MPSDVLAHDINNLLMIVAGCCERMPSHGPLGAEQRAELERIRLATEHAAWLTTQLMTAGAASGPLSGMSVIDTALAQAARLVEHALGDGITVVQKLGAAGAWVPMNEGAATQILINLALNARDAMPQGGELSISSRVWSRDDPAAPRLPADRCVEVEICDTGTGMTAEARALAFVRSFTTKPGRGSGLGLISVHRIVQASGGTIAVRSTPGTGTRFTMLFPVADGPQTSTTGQPRHDEVRARAGETVLVAEDEPAVRDIVAAQLRGLGYDTIDVASAEQALQVAAGQRIDLLVVDLDLPDMNGRQLAERLVATASTTRVLFMSGFSDDAAPLAGAKTGFLQKPFTGSVLGRTVRDILDRAPAGA
jgi:CheY-like chemotaxis protein